MFHLYNNFSFWSNGIAKYSFSVGIPARSMAISFIAFFILSVRLLSPSSLFAQASVANFSADVTSGCGRQIVKFTDLSSNKPTFWLWEFGNGVPNNTLPHPIVNFTKSGRYTIKLTVKNASGTHSVSKVNYITVHPLPVVAFSSPARILCNPPKEASFSATGAGTGATYLWNFGDSKTASGQYPKNMYEAPGKYPVKLVVTSTEGCKDSLTQPGYITARKFVADFKADLMAPCVSSPIQFADLSVPAAATWEWDFGDAGVSFSPNPKHSFGAAGTYKVILTATDGKDASSCVSGKEMLITIYSNPKSGFSASSVSECKVPAVITFTDTTAGSFSRKWTFANGVHATLSPVSYAYMEEKNHTVSLRVTDTNGCSDSVTRVNYIKIKFPAANFTAGKTKGCIPLAVQFTDKSFSNETVTRWAWDFGDNTPGSTLKNPVHTYMDTGKFDVRLIIENVKGCIDTFIIKKYITPGKPPLMGFFGSPKMGCFPLKATFKDSTSGYTDQWLWNFGDGKTSVLKNPPAHDYLDTGFFKVTLIAGFHGCSDTLSKANYIYVQPPQALFSSTNPVGCIFPYNVTFTDGSKGADRWFWNFGDPSSGVNNTSTLKNPPSHEYKNPGFYTVTLTDSNTVTKCRNSITKLNYVKISDLNSGYTEGGQVGCQPFKVAFTDTSKTNTSIANWFWDFGDGSTISGSGAVPAGTNNNQTTGTFKVPSHTYTLPDTFSIRLIVTDQLGCKDTTIKPPFLVVKQVPSAIFSADKLKGCVPLTVSFTDASTGIAALKEWLWVYGDGDSAKVKSPPPHIYKTRGSYTISLTVKDVEDCSQTASKTVVPTYPYPGFTYDSIACNKQMVHFTNTSTGTALKYVWDFGDGSVKDTAANPKHVYKEASSKKYTVTLTATDVNGCDSVIVRPIYISRPVANYTASGAISNCPPSSVLFTDASYSTSTPDDKMVSRIWNFGDPASGSGNDIKDSLQLSHSYNSAGKYDVRLIVTNFYGCRDTVIQPELVKVGGPILKSLSFTPKSSGCSPLSVTFNAVGSNIAKYHWIFGDGNDSTTTGGAVQHVYSRAGSFLPVLEYTDAIEVGIPNDATCTILYVPNDTIKVSGPVVDFSPDSVFSCIPMDVTFVNNTKERDNTTWLWNFGDGTISMDTDPLPYRHAAKGSYHVSLTAFVGGCSYTKSKLRVVTVFNPPAIKFTRSDPDGCIPVAVDFKVDTASITTPVHRWKWRFGDGDSLLILDSTQVYTNFNTTHAYKSSGDFYPSFAVVFTETGCEVNYNEKGHAVSILGGPPVDFEILPQVRGNIVNTFDFRNTSVGTVSYHWTFGDGASSTDENPVHMYSSEGTFPVVLTAKNALGCLNSIAKAVQSVAGINLSNVFTPNGDGVNDKFVVDVFGPANKFAIKIFDRWGKTVYESADYQNDWDGKDMNNEILKPDTYYYVLKSKEQFSWNGWVTLIR